VHIAHEVDLRLRRTPVDEIVIAGGPGTMFAGQWSLPA
jgi:hypothetical protein